MLSVARLGRQEAEDFLFEEARLIDDRHFQERLELFTEDGIYWMPASADQQTGEGQPNIFYEDHYLMDMRIRRVEHPYAHSQAAGHRTSHVVSNVMIKSANQTSHELVVTSRFHMVEYRLDDLRHFGGKYTHTLIKSDDAYKIKLQRVDLANVEGPFDFVMQVWL